MKKEKIKSITYVALFVAIIGVVSQIAIPMPSLVPITLQTFVIAMCGYLLGVKRGLAAIIVCIALGAVGAPVFSSFQGGFSVLIGYTGGFIWGFIPLVILCGIFSDKIKGITLGILGVTLCHSIGIIWYMALSGNNFISAFLLVSLPYIIKDIIFIPLAYFVSVKIKNKIKM